MAAVFLSRKYLINKDKNVYYLIIIPVNLSIDYKY